MEMELSAATLLFVFLISLPILVTLCNEHGTIYAISSDFGDRMTTQSMRLMVLLSEHF